MLGAYFLLNHSIYNILVRSIKIMCRQTTLPFFFPRRRHPEVLVNFIFLNRPVLKMKEKHQGKAGYINNYTVYKKCQWYYSIGLQVLTVRCLFCCENMLIRWSQFQLNIESNYRIIIKKCVCSQ